MDPEGVKPRVLEKFDKNYWSAIKRGDKEEAARIKADWEEVEDQACKVAHSFIPVVGSATEACEAFDEGKYVEGAIYTALAVAEAVPIITLASRGLKAGNLVAKVAQVAAAGEKAVMKQMVVEGGEVVRKGTHVVYTGLDKVTETVKYVGITCREPVIRFGEHLSSGTTKSLLEYRILNEGLSNTQARILEQTLINQYGLGAKGGELFNKINSIAPKDWWKYGIK